MFAATFRDAIMGGISDGGSWIYNLIGYTRAQGRLSTAYGIWLDIFAYDYLGNFIKRGAAPDSAFRAVIRATILQERVTRAGMINAVTTLTGTAPAVFEPWNTYDTGAYSGPAQVANSPNYGSMGYGVGRGGYGNMGLPGQVFIQVTRRTSSGVPNVDGYDGDAAGYGVGTIEYAGSYTTLTGVTDPVIYDMINKTKPTGVTAWVAIN